MRSIFNAAIDMLESKFQMRIDRVETHNLSIDNSLDIQPRMTGIRIDYPLRDLHFMFFSKEGIRLPDEDGSISKEIEGSSPDISRVNIKLWEQAIVWPVKHVDYGVWYRPEYYDLKYLNTSLPPLELQWIGCL
jgi:hypothetical protein